MPSMYLNGNRGWLSVEAAYSIHRVDAAIGHQLQITEAGRTWDQQKAHRDRYEAYVNGGPWAPYAAKPGTSPHEFGNAIDTNERTGVLLDHGWRRPLSFEPWHFVYNWNLDNHRHEGNGAGSGSVPFPTPSPTKEGFLMALAPAQQAQIYDANIRHSEAGDYYTNDAILNDVRTYGEGLVARIDAANTRLEAIMRKLEAMDG